MDIPMTYWQVWNRISCVNWRITYLGVYWSESSTVIPMASLQTRIEILSEYRVNTYIAVRHFGLTIQPTIFSVTETQWWAWYTSRLRSSHFAFLRFPRTLASHIRTHRQTDRQKRSPAQPHASKRPIGHSTGIPAGFRISELAGLFPRIFWIFWAPEHPNLLRIDWVMI